MKKLKELSLTYPNEQAYHDDPTISYSNISHYEREGFAGIKTLRDKKESPSLLLGSCVDTMLTDGEDEYYNRFLVAEYPNIPDSIVPIVKVLFRKYCETCSSLYKISDADIINTAKEFDYQNNWKPETRAKVIREKADEYYQLMYLAHDRTIINTELHRTVCNMVDALKTSDNTKWYFEPDNIFENVERCYQPIFKGEYAGIPIKIMADLIIVDHDKKTIQLCDLKTTKDVITFEESFYKWCYFYQRDIYAYVVNQVMLKDDYFKDFRILPTYKFIAIDKTLMEPIVFSSDIDWSSNDIIDCNHDVRKSWTKLIKELDYYIHHPNVQLPIDMMNELNTNYEIKIKQYTK